MDELWPDDPRQIGRYRLLRRLGAGGMGEVFLGRTAGGRTVAVKLVRGEYAGDEEFRARFRQEVTAARRVGGSWTAPVLDADTEGPQPWVATGYVAGPALGTAVRQFGPLPAAAVRTLGAGLAQALEAVHGLGLVHRDVKPSNVLLALDGPRLIDFGITRALDASTALTRSGFVVGSPGYLSPEQAQGLPAGPPSDVFSLGAVLAFAATGVPPFGDGVSAAVLLYRVLYEAPGLNGTDDGLHALLLACLAKDPAQRPTPAALRDGLLAGGPAVPPGHEGWLPPAVAGSLARLAVELLDLDSQAEEATPAPAPAAPARRRRGPLAAAAGGVLAAAAVTAGLWIADSAQGDRTAGTGTPTPTAAAPSTPEGAVPAAFLGTWRGEMASALSSLKVDFRITVAQGRAGEPVADIHNNSGAGTSYCDASALLVSSAPGRLVLRTAPLSGLSGCTAVTAQQVYTVNGDGSLHLQVDGFSGELDRQP
ncbi:serine/threonine-protein kinase [Kitasatospora sp. NPDC057223]|uniref:serine/threonine-protein kinase n=1 Tax=Kitasatospora sp. NPDC057223 TaxID=3346055 RepID=UPI0036403A05